MRWARRSTTSTRPSWPPSARRSPRAEAVIERYLDAFEAGTLPEDTCGQRVQRLGGKIAELRVREQELRQAMAMVEIQASSRHDLDDLAEQVRFAVQTGPMPTCKKVIQALVHEIRVESKPASSQSSASRQQRPRPPGCPGAEFDQ